MSSDHVSETTRRSWFQRMGAAFTGVLAGLVIVVVGIGLLAWNEGRSIARIRGLGEGGRAVVTAPLTRIDPANEGLLIHLSGPLVVEGRREDPASGVSVGGVSLRRTVEYYQWTETSRSETRTRPGGGEETVTTYDYQREWSGTPRDSSQFHTPAGHTNLTPPIETALVSAEEGRVGAYRADRRLLDTVPPTVPVTVTEADARRLSATLSRPVRVESGALYVGANPASPAVGDMRVRYVAAPAGVVSVAAAQKAGALAPFVTGSGSEIYLTADGAVGADEMFQRAKDGNQVLSWILRAAGIIGLMVGLGLTLGPLATLADVLPPIGAVVRFGTGALAGLGGLGIGLLVIAVSWFVVRPVLAIISLVAIGGAVAGVIWLRARWRRPDAVPLMAPPK